MTTKDAGVFAIPATQEGNRVTLPLLQLTDIVTFCEMVGITQLLNISAQTQKEEGMMTTLIKALFGRYSYIEKRHEDGTITVFAEHETWYNIVFYGHIFIGYMEENELPKLGVFRPVVNKMILIAIGKKS